MILVAFDVSDDMVEHENETLRDRVSDLEKRVHDQNDEITCLRATLADALRRINTLESGKGNRTHIIICQLISLFHLFPFCFPEHVQVNHSVTSVGGRDVRLRPRGSDSQLEVPGQGPGGGSRVYRRPGSSGTAPSYAPNNSTNVEGGATSRSGSSHEMVNR